MKAHLANTIKLGDIVYDCFMNELVVTSINKDIKSQEILFGTVDTRLNRAIYTSNDLYDKNFTDESDDEKSWVDWAKNNKDFFDEFDHIETMRELYKVAFCNGFEYKKKTTFEEAMQK